MELIRCTHSIAGRTVDGDVLVALIDGEMEAGRARCVGLVLCSPQAAKVLELGIGSTLRTPEP